MHSTIQPTFQKSSYTMAFRQQVFSDSAIRTLDLVAIPHSIKAMVSFPAVRANYTSRYNHFFYGLLQGRSRCIRNTHKSYAPNSLAVFLRGNQQQFFTFSASPPATRLCRTDKRLINLNCTREVIAARTYHCSAKLVKPSPGGTVTTKPENTLQAQGIGPVLLACDVPHCSEPERYRLLAVLKNCTRNHGCLSPAGRAFIQSRTNSPRSHLVAYRADETIRPAKFPEVLQAGIFSGKPVLEFHKIARVTFHALTLYIVGTLVKCIPRKRFIKPL